MAQLHVLDHPLIKHKLSLLRKRTTSTAEFRALTRELSLLMCYEATRTLQLETVDLSTPLERMEGFRLKGKKLCLVSILRAGNGMLDGMLELIPAARVGHIGLYRNPDTLEAIEYFLKLPDSLSERLCLVVDPMLATGHSAAAALTRLKDRGAQNLLFLCLLAAPEGVQHLQQTHPDVSIVTCSLDRCLNEHGYICPGLGDAGDRLFGTR